MRWYSALKNDIRYQYKYGFYFLYAFMSVIYTCILLMLPQNIKAMAAQLIILTDPAALGFLFIGGIWLLEKGEGLLDYFIITPLTINEYIASKTVSLSLISTMAGVIISTIGLKGEVNAVLLGVGLLIGSMVFTLSGLYFGTYAKSVNNYLIITLPIEMVLMLPPMLIVFGIVHPILEIFPGSILLRIIGTSVGKGTIYPVLLSILGLIIWLGIAWKITNLRLNTYWFKGGEKN